MRNNRVYSWLAICVVLLSSCLKQEPIAYGHFEAREWMVAAGGSGRILELDYEEGDLLTKGQRVGQIDTTELSLQQQHLERQMVTLRASLPDVGLQIGTLKEQRSVVAKELQRVERLVEAGAADRKKLEQVGDELGLIDRQIAAGTSSLHREAAAILAQIETLEMQRDIVAHRIAECSIVNPEEGVVALQLAKVHQFVATGHPLYKLMDTREMTLHSWLPGELLPQLSMGGEVRVGVDQPDGKMKYYVGRVTYMADKPEFTPGQVQTRQNRSLLFYHVKMGVTNDGTIKPGMAAEVYLQTDK